jgi:hypothetical protein
VGREDTKISSVDQSDTRIASTEVEAPTGYIEKLKNGDFTAAIDLLKSSGVKGNNQYYHYITRPCTYMGRNPTALSTLSHRHCRRFLPHPFVITIT